MIRHLVDRIVDVAALLDKSSRHPEVVWMPPSAHVIMLKNSMNLKKKSKLAAKHTNVRPVVGI